MKKFIINPLLAVILLASLVAPVIIGAGKAYAVAWYNVNWQYRKSATVTGGVASYQTRILVGETSGATGEDVDCGGFVQTDFDDLRFTGADGVTKLPYWIETITGTTPNQLATVWVKNDATPSATIYMYYGNPSVTSESSGYNTFNFFSDFGGVNWSYATGGHPAEHSVIQNNILYQVSGGDGIFMLDPDDGTLINQWLAGVEIWGAPVIKDGYIYCWSYTDSAPGEQSTLYKVNESDGTSVHIHGTDIDFETLTYTTVGGIDLIFIPKGQYVTAIKMSDLSTYWTSTVYVEDAIHHWDGGTVVGNYLYTRQSKTADYKICKVDLTDGSVDDFAALTSQNYYAALIYDADSDQIFAPNMWELTVVAFDAQTLDTNWTFTMDETGGSGAGKYHIMYSGAYHNGVLYYGNKQSDATGINGYVYAVNAATGAKIWKNTTFATNSVVPTNMVLGDDYLFVPTHDYVDNNYHQLAVINITNGILYDTISQSGDSACASPLVWGGKIFLGMWTTTEVNCRVLGSGQAVNNPYKMDSYHTGYIDTALVDYTPDKSPEGDDLTAWTTLGTVTVSGGTAIVDSTVGVPDANLYTNGTWDANYAVRTRMKTAHSNAGTAIEDLRYAVYATAKGYHAMFDYSGAVYPGTAGNYDGAWSALTEISGSWAADTYGTVDIIRNGVTNAIYRINDTTVATIATNLTATACNLDYQANTVTGVALITVDWSIVRKYQSAEPTFGSWSAPESPVVPAVTTGTATAYTATGVTLQGSLTSLGGYTPVYCYFQYGISTAYGATTVEQTETAIGGITQAITGLTPSQVYHFRIVARYDGSNYIYGADSFFTFVPGGGAGGTPTITTGSAVNLAATTATLQGTLDGLAGYSPVYCYFQYGTTISYGTNTLEQTMVAAAGFNQAITGLVPSTTYHFRAVVRYSATDYVYGSDASFLTTSGATTTTTYPVVIEPLSPATLNGVFVYEDCKEDGDVGVLINYDIDYGTPTSTTAPNPSQAADRTFMFTFTDTDGVTKLKTVTPYCYVNRGYGHGLAWIYFTPTEATAYGLSSTTVHLYSIRLEGNPMLTWENTDPPVTVGSLDYWQPAGTSTASLIAVRLLNEVSDVSQEWVSSSLSVPLLGETPAGFKLTTTGSDYMGGVIPGLRNIAPSIYSSISEDPTMEDIDYSSGFGATMTNGTGTVAGSPITFAEGNTTVVVTAPGNFTIVLSKGTSGTITSGTGTVTGSPVTLVPGTSTVTFTGAGNAVVSLSRVDLTGKASSWVIGTAFDLTSAATAFGMSRWMFSGLVWLLVSVLVCAALYRTSPEENRGGAMKVVMLLFDVCIIGGILLGLLHPIVGALLFIGFSVFIGYVFFFQKSSV